MGLNLYFIMKGLFTKGRTNTQESSVDSQEYANAMSVEVDENERLDVRASTRQWSHINLQPLDPKRLATN